MFIAFFGPNTLLPTYISLIYVVNKAIVSSLRPSSSFSPSPLILQYQILFFNFFFRVLKNEIKIQI